ncbi:MAG: hypothetical protein BIFFINMI_01785 [Phycisphaerae bacterium]|nr:hypothetical protein [Phycisphaerae bacterium]
MRHLLCVSVILATVAAACVQAASGDLAALAAKAKSGDIEAIQALGKLGPDAEEAVPALYVALREGKPEARAQAALALGKIGNSAVECMPQMTRALADTDAAVREAAATGLGDWGNKAARAGGALVDAMHDDPVPAVRLAAIRSLGAIFAKRGDVTPRMQQAAMCDPDPGVCDAAGEALALMRAELPRDLGRAMAKLAVAKDLLTGLLDLGEFGPLAKPAIPNVLAALKDPDEWTRNAAVSCIGKMGPTARECIPQLIEAMNDRSEHVRRSAAEALAVMGPLAKGAIPALIKAATSDKPLVQGEAARCLGKIAGPQPEAVAALMTAVNSKPPARPLRDGKDVRAGGADGLSCCGEAAAPAVPTLVKMLADPDPEVVAAAARCLARVGPPGKAASGALLKVNSKSALVRAPVAEALGNCGADGVPALTDMLENGPVELVVPAATALGRIGPPAAPAAVAIVKAVGKVAGNARAREALMDALAKIGPAAVPGLAVWFEQARAGERIDLCEALGRIGSKDAVPALTKIVQAPAGQPEWRTAAIAALDRITGHVHTQVQHQTLGMLWRWGGDISGTACSPDGRRFAHVARIARSEVVYVDGQRLADFEKELAAGAAVPKVDPYSLGFSPDGTRVVYVAGTPHFVVLDGERHKPWMQVHPDGLTFSPDGRQLAYRAGVLQNQRKIFLESAEIVENSSAPRPRLVFAPERLAFSPDSNIFATEQFYVNADGIQARVFLQRRGERVTTMNGCLPVFSPDSKRFAYVDYDPAKKKNISMVDGARGKVEGLTSEISFSPDSRKWACAVTDGGQTSVVINDQVVSSFPEFSPLGPVVFSPDGSRYACAGTRGRGRCFVVLDGKEDKTFFTVAERSLVFSPDSRRFGYVAGLDDNKAQMILNGVASPTYTICSSLIFSPDSKRAAFLGGRHNPATSSRTVVCVLDGVESAPYVDQRVPSGTIHVDASDRVVFSSDSKHLAHAGTTAAFIDGRKIGDYAFPSRGFRLAFDAPDRLRFTAFDLPGVVRVEVKVNE